MQDEKRFFSHFSIFLCKRSQAEKESAMIIAIQTGRDNDSNNGNTSSVRTDFDLRIWRRPEVCTAINAVARQLSI